MQLGHEDQGFIKTMTEDSYHYLGVLQLGCLLQTSMKESLLESLFKHLLLTSMETYFSHTPSG